MQVTGKGLLFERHGSMRGMKCATLLLLASVGDDLALATDLGLEVTSLQLATDDVYDDNHAAR